MKILFLQKVDNARGGVINVNLGLMNYFLSCGFSVEMLSIRHGDTWERIEYPDSVKKTIINETAVWGCPRLNEVLSAFKAGKISRGFQTLWARYRYKKAIFKDYQSCQSEIRKIAPDIIINSHYEVLDGIPKEYLNRTVMHFHTNYIQVKTNRSYQQIFNQYKDQIACFVWLSKGTCQSAIADGLVNSRYIYNSLSFKEDRCASLQSKKLVFVGRIAPEKRVWLAIDHFLKAIEKPEFQDWVFEIYGNGEEEDKMQELIKGHDQIVYKGQTNHVQEAFLGSSLMIMTSSFEGMPLVVLEANECGVPVLAYDFGESSHEVIIHEQTGILIDQAKPALFQASLEELMRDTNRRMALGRNAKQFAQNFSIEKIGAEWLNLFKTIQKEEN